MDTVIRPAAPEDLPGIARLAGELVRMHHRFDPLRFFLPPDVEAGYAWYFRGELANDAAVILAAVAEGAIVGYAYGRLEPRDWNNLLDAAGALHDVYVADEARRAGVGRALVSAMVERLKTKGAPRVVLHTASQNEAARRLFASLGFRATMIEMTREA